MDVFLSICFMIMLLIIGVFIGFNISKSNLKEMETSFTELREMKKKCEINLPRTQKCKIIFVGDL